MHRFPKDKDLAQQWLVACKRADKVNTATARVCSRHFKVQDFETSLKSKLMDNQVKLRLKRTSVPTVMLHPSQPPAAQSDRDSRQNTRQKKKLVEALTRQNDEELNPPDVISSEEEARELTPEEKIKKLEEELAAKDELVGVLKRKLLAEQKKNSRLRMSKKKARKLSSPMKIKMAKELLPRKTNLSRKQVNFFLDGKKRSCWSSEDIVLGLTIRALSRKVYQLLRKRKLLPLPGLSTLRKHVKHFQCLPGILTDVLTGKVVSWNSSQLGSLHIKLQK